MNDEKYTLNQPKFLPQLENKCCHRNTKRYTQDKELQSQNSKKIKKIQKL